MPLIDALNLVFLQNLPLFFVRAALHRNLVKVRIQLILVALNPAVVPDSDARLVVSENAVVFNLGEARAGADDSATLVFVDLVI